MVVVGAVLAWAVTVKSTVLNVHLAGIIIFVVGIVGMIISLFLWFTWRNREEPPHDQTRRDFNDSPRG